MERTELKVLFLGKANDTWTSKASKFIKQYTNDLEEYYGEWGTPYPESLKNWSGDLVISYLSRWILPESLLKSAKLAAINFHPAPPEYPGIGCCNFALYNNAAVYGATCHLMEAEVDTGAIIRVKRFPILECDNVSTLLTKTYDIQLSLFYEVMGEVLTNNSISLTNEKWSEKKYTRAELNALSEIKYNMSANEIRKRIRATSFKNFQPSIEVGGYRFYFRNEQS
ncbi:hypothetical protein KJY73_04815 [Bowmanella sp. Y26]|uniref:formyltransferase family protein n=1 Tax=Bowmanella yangjiangensis TaxID=2811230 RepID=UPI001BDC413A|nr:formyltransferase family protein [Bowmanella yangjiangensis]MBT1062883.1 hypothetical protein [Bowmanella yangjiangensis]